MSDEPRRTTIGESSVIRVSLALALAAYVGVLMWKVSAISTKVDMILQSQTRYDGDYAAIRTRIEALEKHDDMYMSSGSPALRSRVDVLERGLAVVVKDLEVHKAQTSNGKDKQ